MRPVTGALIQKLVPRSVSDSGMRGRGTSINPNTHAYRDDRKKRPNSYGYPPRGSGNPYAATYQSPKRGHFQCRYCCRTFIYRTPFIAHEEAHVNDKRFRCCYCPESFITRQLLSIHLRVHKDDILEDCDGAL
ncbi:hypothetical protein HPB50_003086 [Hyalomma asiaticum]|uniref:Uncharacterized protein n=1 Tax=Hyalomma asiaticum TaxID=266040 RepID=A0ACB7RJX2_HYAAI|nr:hypothetical protein HPB50_003086 [Hyalomma asiaticum]